MRKECEFLSAVSVLAKVNWSVIITAITNLSYTKDYPAGCGNSLRAGVVKWQPKELSRSSDMPEEITSNVEALEAEAEKILAEAKTRASEIVLQAKEEARKMLSSQLPLDEVNTECEQIVSKAKAEADGRIKESEKSAAEITITADKKVKELTGLVVDIVRGKS